MKFKPSFKPDQFVYDRFSCAKCNIAIMMHDMGICHNCHEKELINYNFCFCKQCNSRTRKENFCSDTCKRKFEDKEKKAKIQAEKNKQIQLF